MNKIKVALIGPNGFVGENINTALLEKGIYDVIPVTRETPLDILRSVDVVIHSGNPAKRFKAENNPEEDFKQTVLKTSKIYQRSKDKRFILISSMSCRTQLYTHYGRHRRACELMIENEKSLVIRLGPMFGGNRKEDMLHDILAGKNVYVSEDTLYSYADVSWVGKKIVSLIDGPSGVVEVGANNYVRLGDIRDYFGTTTKFEGRVENQITQGSMEGPDANYVYVYAKKEYYEIKGQ